MKNTRWILGASAGATIAAVGLVFSLTGAADPQGPTAPKRLVGPHLVLDLGWGNATDEVGREDRQEGASVGPMSFTINGLGEVYVLDQVNLRIQKYLPDGTLERSIPVPRPSIQDIAVYDEGLVVVVDRLVSRSVLVLDEAGTLIVEHPIEGEGVPEGGAVTGLFTAEDGVWLEVLHRDRVRVLNEWLEPCDRTVRPGRVLVPGKSAVVATWDVSGIVQLDVQQIASGRISASRVVSFDHRIARVLWIEAGPTERLYAVFHLFEQDRKQPGVTLHDELVVVVFDYDLQPLEEIRVPHAASRREQVRHFKVAPDGSLYQLVFSDAGVSLRQWSWSW